LTVVDSDQIDALASSVPFSREQVRQRVTERAAAMLEIELKDAGVEVEPGRRHVAVGRPGREVVAACERLGAGLLVIGYHGHSKPALGPGSVASRCIRHAPCDVLLTRREHPGPFGRVAVGVELCGDSRDMVAHADAIARVDGAEMVLVHAHSDPGELLAFAGYGVDPLPPRGTPDPAMIGRLERMAEGLRPGCAGGVRAEVVVDSNHGRAIAEWCVQEKADLTVVGTQARPGLRYWLLGSTAEAVLRQTGCAVLAVRGELEPE
jgi:nucleotide-binding universal stress UspA family protein